MSVSRIGKSRLLPPTEPLAFRCGTYMTTKQPDSLVHLRAHESMNFMKGSFRDLLEAAPDAMIVVSGRGEVVLVNTQTEKLFGYQRNELLHQSVEILIPSRFRKQHQTDRADFFTHAHSRSMGSGLDLVGLRKDGSEFPVDVMLSPVATEDGTVVLSIIRDITERKQNEELARQNSEMKMAMAVKNAELAAAKKELELIAESERMAEALRRSEARVRHLVDSSIIGIATGDLDGRLIDANDACLKMLGCTREDLSAGQMRWDVITPPEFHDSDRKIVEQLRRTGVATPWEKQFICKDGKRVSVLIGVTTMIGISGETEAVSFILDLTERKRLEQQLRQAQKMEAVGQLAGGIAHDFNNLLSIIIGYSELLEARFDASDPLRAKLEQIRRAGQRAATLTRQLLTFSRKQVLEPKVLELNHVVADTLRMLQYLIGEDIELIAVPRSNLWHVSADPGQVEQVIINLAVNARDAMPKGGKLTIETDNFEIDEVFVRQHAGSVPGSYVMLSVTDTGCGMDEETKGHIFEPFFTTKALGKGTGLGLATVYGVVKQSGGYISVYSDLGRGTSFKIYLPRAERSVPPAVSVSGGTGRQQGSETILLVEDADPLRELAGEILREAGYTLLQAANGADAIRVTEAYREPIHLLLTDVVMPEIDGPKLAERLLRIHPGIKVLYMSGYTDESLSHHGVRGSGISLLQKPFTRESITRKVREVLSAEGANIEAAGKIPRMAAPPLTTV